MITIEQAISDLRQGKFIIILDAEERENEGDLALAAETATAEVIAEMCHLAGGLLALAFPASRHEDLAIDPLPTLYRTEDTPFCESVDYVGITDSPASALGRLQTARAIMNPDTRPQDLARPGHLITLRGRNAGLYEREGHTEAIIDLARLAGLYPAGFLCEILYGTGMARGPILEAFARERNIGMISIRDIAEYRRKIEGAPEGKDRRGRIPPQS